MTAWTGILLLAGAEAAMAVEEPTYRVLERREAFEVRVYAPVVVAETSVAGEFGPAGNEAFRLLAGYIFGGNGGGKKIAMTAPVVTEPRGGTRIAMTAPVAQERRGESWVVSFTMPSEWTLESLPVPDDPRVTLREVGPRRVAAVSFSGTWGVERFEEKTRELLDEIGKAGLVPASPPVYARYDPPWTPWFLRRNEILVPLAEVPAPEKSRGPG